MHSFHNLFFLVFLAIFALVAGSILIRIVKGISGWTSNTTQPVQQVQAEIVAKRTEVSGGQNSTSTAYFATFELAGGVRIELRVSGRDYGQLAESDQGRLTYQGTRFHGFARQPRRALPPPVPAPPRPADRRCDYCGAALPPGEAKCGSCGWTWRPPPSVQPAA